MCREIPLSKGHAAIVDDEDFERVAALKWTFDRYAYRKVRERLGKGQYRVRHLSLQNFILNAAPGQLVDHRDRDRLNCRRDNLRIATRAQNNANSGPRGNAKYKGISWRERDRCWIAQITTEGKYHHLGTFRSPEEAAKAYNAAAFEAWGEFAFLNPVAPAPTP